MLSPRRVSPEDACPGVVRVHEAADGGLARVRVPGGWLAAAQLRVLADVAERHGSGVLELTSRANVQVRGLGPAAAAPVARELWQVGLLPSAAHERIRNIVASVLSRPARAVAGDLDRALLADPALAALPGRWLFTVDDGRDDVTPLRGDVGLHLGARGWELLLDGTPTGPGSVEAALAAARAFLAERAAQGSAAWRLRELTDGAERVAGRLGVATGAGGAASPGAAEPMPGVVATVPLGRLDAAQARGLADLAAEVQITPRRAVAVPDPRPATAAALDALGLPTGPTGWSGVTACTGRPGCAKALADVRADATAAHAGATAGPRTHWSGCERRCGRPAGPHVELVATGHGYERAMVRA